MGGHTRAGRILGSLGVAVLLAGCSTGASLTPTLPTPTGMVATPAVTTTPMTTLAPTPSPTPAARAFGPATVVSGIESCSLQYGTTTIVGETEQMRGATLTCTETANDPRVSGTTLYTWNYDLWYDGRDFAHVQWGTGRIENAGGAWEGTLSGVYSSETHEDALTFWFTGTGGYEGLSYFMRFACGATPGLTVPTEGMIFPGEPPTP
jgi:hypothetical protein